MPNGNLEVNSSTKQVVKIDESKILKESKALPGATGFYIFVWAYMAFAPLTGMVINALDYFEPGWQETTLVDFFWGMVGQMKALTNWLAISLTVFGWANLIHWRKAMRGEHWASNNNYTLFIVVISVAEMCWTWFGFIVPGFDFFNGLGHNEVWYTIDTMNIHFVCPLLIFIFFKVSSRKKINVSKFVKNDVWLWTLYPTAWVLTSLAYGYYRYVFGLGRDPAEWSGQVVQYGPAFDPWLHNEGKREVSPLVGWIWYLFNYAVLMAFSFILSVGIVYRNNMIVQAKINKSVVDSIISIENQNIKLPPKMVKKQIKK